MRRFSLFSLFQERVARRVCPSRWSARRRASRPASGGLAAVESLESRCLLAAGDLDPSFGVAGRVLGPSGVNGKVVVAIQGDGKVVVADTVVFDGMNADFTVTRYNANGSLDTTFGGTGKVVTDLGDAGNIRSVAVQSDGKIVVVGYRTAGSQPVFALVRYSTDGSLDASFGGTGIVTTAIDSYSAAESIAIQADGRIVVAGWHQNSTHDHSGFAIVRYNSNGSLDTSFDGDGKLTTDFGNANDVAYNLVIQTDGKIVASGDRLVRYNANGSLDTSFGGTGIIRLEGTATNLALENDGKIVIAGMTYGPALLRYNTDGSVDASFDGRGINDAPIPSSIAIQSDGKIVIASGTNGDFLLYRIKMDGSLDFSFGTHGAVTTDFGFTSDGPSSMALQSNGKLIVAGISYSNASQILRFAVARYFTDEQPPVFTSANVVNAEENQTTVLTFTATDPESRLLTYGITGGDDQAKFSINSFTGAMSFVVAPDFENPTDSNHDNIYEVQVAASDGANLVQQAMAVTVTDKNEAPTITSASSVNVAENATAVLTVSGTDPEHGALTYSLAGGADDSLFSLNLTTGALAFLAAPNFESPQDADHNNVYDVRVSVSDGTNAVTQDIHVTATNVDETPSITSANAASVLENATAVIIVAATDPQHDSLSFSLSGGADQTLFNIDADSGAVSFKSAPNFENPTDANHDNVYSVQVQVSDGTNLVTQNLNITVTNVDESPTITSASTASIPENTSFVFNVTGSDPDGHSLLYGITGGADQSKFTLNFLTGALSFVSPPDFEHPTDANHTTSTKSKSLSAMERISSRKTSA